MSANVGIDVSKDTLEWTAAPKGHIHSCKNQRRVIARLVKEILEKKPTRIIVESTGGYERELVEQLVRASLAVAIVNPWRVRRFGEGMGILAKTDTIDARLLSLYGEKANVPLRPIVQGNARIRCDLVARRRQLIQMIVAEKARVEKAPAIVRREMRPCRGLDRR